MDVPFFNRFNMWSVYNIHNTLSIKDFMKFICIAILFYISDRRMSRGFKNMYKRMLIILYCVILEMSEPKQINVQNISYYYQTNANNEYNCVTPGVS